MVLQTAAVNVAMFIVSRIILGLGIPFCISGASQLIAELAYPSHTSVINGLFVQSLLIDKAIADMELPSRRFNESWYAGAIIAAGVSLGTYDIPTNWAWRIPSLLQIVPSLLQLTFIWFIPESPRWLISRDRHEEAFEILVKYHAEGDRESALVKAEFEEVRICWAKITLASWILTFLPVDTKDCPL